MKLEKDALVPCLLLYRCMLGNSKNYTAHYAIMLCLTHQLFTQLKRWSLR